MLARGSLYSLKSLILVKSSRAALPVIQARSYAKGKSRRIPESRPPIHSYKSRVDPEPQKFSEPGAAAAAFRAAEKQGQGFENPGLPNISSLRQEYDGILQSRDSDQPLNPHHLKPEQDGESIDQKSTGPLPDLTQGIPSSLNAELAQASRGSRLGNADVASQDSDTGEKAGGDLPRTAYISSLERRRNLIATYFYCAALAGATVGTLLLGRNWGTDEEERKHPDAPSGWGFGLFYNRVGARLAGMLDYYNEPAFPKLLPDLDKTLERPYTLVLSLEDLLVHSEWDREHGWRLAKRPGVDYFLRYLSQYYELVIFTSTPSAIAQPIINKLDPFRIVLWPLFREATRYKKGQYIKDLEFLNRPLNKIIMIDTVPAHATNQPENAIILDKWKGDSRDKELVSFIPFLEYVASMEFNDTRDVIKSFSGTHIPTEFAKREAVAREKFFQQLAAEKSIGKGKSMGGLGSVFGMKPQPGMDGMELRLSEGFAQGKTFQDQVRERGQKAYEVLDKELRENGEKWLKEMAEEEKKANDEMMKATKSQIVGWTTMGLFGGSSSPSSPSSSSES